MLLFKSTGHRISLLCNVSRNVRLFASTPSEIPKKDETIFEIPKKDQSASASLGGGGMNRNTHKVDNLERKMLVWTGKYKNADDVPSYVNQDVMEKTRNRIRIRLANIMMALTALGCIFMIFSGKSAAERGETVQKMNLDWHKEYNEQEAAKAKKQKN
ncbi:unnamed protein product [Diamesa hyperborea]